MTRFRPIPARFGSASTKVMPVHVLQAGVKKLFGFCGVHRSLRLPIRPADNTMLESRKVQLIGRTI
jgi:hypothetical protein